MVLRDAVWKMGGDQGSGIETAGEVMAACLHRLGYWVFGYRSFMSLIKGGYTAFHVRAAAAPLGHHGDAADVVAALSPGVWRDRETGLAPGAVLLHAEEAEPPSAEGHPSLLVPARELARQAGNPLARNMVLLGASAAVLGLPLPALLATVTAHFARKGEEAARQNARACALGHEHARRHLPALPPFLPPPPAASTSPGDVPGGSAAPPADGERAPALPGFAWDTPPPPAEGEGLPPHRLLVTGNEALALGAAVAGCRYFAAYPITPATEIFYRLQALLPPLGGVVVQAEDELAAVCQAIGASFAGARAMTATSGPGFSLMQEALGLAGMAEMPLVVVNVQRGGPATGLPTRTEQGDLDQMLHGSHGEFPRLVLAPHSTLDCYHAAQEALTLADLYQCPVILASDLHLGMSLASIPWPAPERLPTSRGRLAAARPPAPEGAPAGPAEGALSPDGGERQPARFRRYALSPDGISPRAIPGQPGLMHTALGNEHDEAGRETEDPETRRAQMDKRRRKLAAVAAREDGLLTWAADGGSWAVQCGFYNGPEEPAVVLVGWGSTGGCLAEARRRLEQGGVAAGHLHLRLLHPFPAAWVKRVVPPGARLLTVEQNQGGQLRRLLAEQGLTSPGYGRYDGRPLLPAEVAAAALAAAPPGGRERQVFGRSPARR